jgi:hypothetical protein
VTQVQFAPEVPDELAEVVELDGVDARLDVRRALLARFPYALVFLILEEGVRILAVAHAKRRPGYWLGRVRP